MISSTIAYLVEQGKEVHFDAEHFYDGYQDNPSYALECLNAAAEARRASLVLCDTRGASVALLCPRSIRG